MPALNFDETKKFDDNLETFLAYMDSQDSELGAILRANVNELKGASDDSDRRRARTEFNNKIIAALDEKEQEDTDE